MTKQIRIENADTSDHDVTVFVEDFVNGEWVRGRQVGLGFPTAMAAEFIHSTRRLVIEEDPKS
jgi:hypothetical protein